jgi:hypothetical protein
VQAQFSLREKIPRNTSGETPKCGYTKQKRKLPTKEKQHTTRKKEKHHTTTKPPH